MRRTTAAATGGLVALVASLAAAAPAAAGPVFHLSFHGQVALAAWTSCPQPQVGDSCFDTVVIASDATTYENSDQEGGGHFLHDRGDRVILRHFWYDVREVDGEVWFVPTRESFGGTDVGVQVGIHQRLTSATASAPSIPMHTSDYVTGQEYDETGSVSAAWQPAGDLVRIGSRQHSSTRDYFFLSSTAGWERTATATGVDDGVPITRSVVLGDTTMYSVRQVELSVYKGRPQG
jgi:hypothetical protein